MITLQQFQSITAEEQKKYLVSLIGDIETDTNQELLLCQRLLQTIAEPSSKTLQYIFDIIRGQLQGLYQQENAEYEHHQTNKVSALLEHIRKQEEAEQEDVDTILQDIDLFNI